MMSRASGTRPAFRIILRRFSFMISTVRGFDVQGWFACGEPGMRLPFASTLPDCGRRRPFTRQKSSGFSLKSASGRSVEKTCPPTV